MRRGFTMIELIFVIVIIGILAAVAIPKLAGTAEKARISTMESFMGSLNRSVGPAMWADMVTDSTQKGSVVTVDDSTVLVSQYTDIPKEFEGLEFSKCADNAPAPTEIGRLTAANSGLKDDVVIYCKDGTLSSAPTFGFSISNVDGNETNGTFSYDGTL